MCEYVEEGGTRERGREEGKTINLDFWTKNA